MIYLDSSVALATVFVEQRRPQVSLWNEHLISSRLLEYEMVNRIHSVGAGAAAITTIRRLLADVTLLNMTSEILARALEPFPVALRTLDSLHLATMDFLRSRGQSVQLASYDKRLSNAAIAIGFSLADL